MKKRKMEQLTNEEFWLPIEGWNYYEISNKGRVKTIPHQVACNKGNKTVPLAIRNGSKASTGYLMVLLSNGSKRQNFLVHRLVAKAYIPNPNNFPQVNHLFGNKMDNRVSSLEWTTGSLNIKHAFDKLGKKPSKTMLGRFGANNPLSKKISQYDKELRLLASFDSITEASKKTGIRINNISACTTGRRKTTGGYIWKFN